MASEMPQFGDKVKTQLDNLVVVGQQLETSQSDVQWRDRFWKVAEDTTTINMSCELGGDIGSFASCTAANKIADCYVEEIVNTAVTIYY